MNRRCQVPGFTGFLASGAALNHIFFLINMFPKLCQLFVWHVSIQTLLFHPFDFSASPLRGDSWIFRIICLFFTTAYSLMACHTSGHLYIEDADKCRSFFSDYPNLLIKKMIYCKQWNVKCFWHQDAKMERASAGFGNPAGVFGAIPKRLIFLTVWNYWYIYIPADFYTENYKKIKPLNSKKHFIFKWLWSIIYIFPLYF